MSKPFQFGLGSLMGVITVVAVCAALGAFGILLLAILGGASAGYLISMSQARAKVS